MCKVFKKFVAGFLSLIFISTQCLSPIYGSENIAYLTLNGAHDRTTRQDIEVLWNQADLLNAGAEILTTGTLSPAGAGEIASFTVPGHTNQVVTGDGQTVARFTVHSSGMPATYANVHVSNTADGVSPSTNATVLGQEQSSTFTVTSTLMGVTAVSFGGEAGSAALTVEPLLTRLVDDSTGGPQVGGLGLGVGGRPLEAAEVASSGEEEFPESFGMEARNGVYIGMAGSRPPSSSKIFHAIHNRYEVPAAGFALLSAEQHPDRTLFANLTDRGPVVAVRVVLDGVEHYGLASVATQGSKLSLGDLVYTIKAALTSWDKPMGQVEYIIYYSHAGESKRTAPQKDELRLNVFSRLSLGSSVTLHSMSSAGLIAANSSGSFGLSSEDAAATDMNAWGKTDREQLVYIIDPGTDLQDGDLITSLGAGGISLRVTGVDVDGQKVRVQSISPAKDSIDEMDFEELHLFYKVAQGSPVSSGTERDQQLIVASSHELSGGLQDHPLFKLSFIQLISDISELGSDQDTVYVFQETPTMEIAQSIIETPNEIGLYGFEINGRFFLGVQPGSAAGVRSEAVLNGLKAVENTFNFLFFSHDHDEVLPWPSIYDFPADGRQWIDMARTAAVDQANPVALLVMSRATGVTIQVGSSAKMPASFVPIGEIGNRAILLTQRVGTSIPSAEILNGKANMAFWKDFPQGREVIAQFWRRLAEPGVESVMIVDHEGRWVRAHRQLTPGVLFGPHLEGARDRTQMVPHLTQGGDSGQRTDLSPASMGIALRSGAVDEGGRDLAQTTTLSLPEAQALSGQLASVSNFRWVSPAWDVPFDGNVGGGHRGDYRTEIFRSPDDREVQLIFRCKEVGVDGSLIRVIFSSTKPLTDGDKNLLSQIKVKLRRLDTGQDQPQQDWRQIPAAGSEHGYTAYAMEWRLEGMGGYGKQDQVRFTVEVGDPAEAGATDGDNLTLDGSPTTPLVSSGAEVSPGEVVPAHADVQVRTRVITDLQREIGFHNGLNPILERFLSGEDGFDFDMAPGELVERSELVNSVITRDEAINILFQVWIGARWDLSYQQARRVFLAVSDQLMRMMILIDLPKLPGRTLAEEDAREIFEDAERIQKLAGIIAPDPMATAMNDYIGAVRQALEDGEDDEGVAISEALLSSTLGPAPLAMFSLLAAPGADQVDDELIVDLAIGAVWAMTPGVKWGAEVPVLNPTLFEAALRGVLASRMTDEIPTEIREAALIGGDVSVAIGNLAAVAGYILAEAINRSLDPQDLEEEAEFFRGVVNHLRQQAWYFGREGYREGHSFERLWMQEELDVYLPRAREEVEAIEELVDLAQTRRFSRMIFQDDQGESLEEFDLPLDPSLADRRISELVRQQITLSNEEPASLVIIPRADTVFVVPMMKDVSSGAEGADKLIEMLGESFKLPGAVKVAVRASLGTGVGPRIEEALAESEAFREAIVNATNNPKSPLLAVEAAKRQLELKTEAELKAGGVSRDAAQDLALEKLIGRAEESPIYLGADVVRLIDAWVIHQSDVRLNSVGVPGPNGQPLPKSVQKVLRGDVPRVQLISRETLGDISGLLAKASALVGTNKRMPVFVDGPYAHWADFKAAFEEVTEAAGVFEVLVLVRIDSQRSDGTQTFDSEASQRRFTGQVQQDVNDGIETAKQAFAGKGLEIVESLLITASDRFAGAQAALAEHKDLNATLAHIGFPKQNRRVEAISGALMILQAWLVGTEYGSNATFNLQGLPGIGSMQVVRQGRIIFIRLSEFSAADDMVALTRMEVTGLSA